MQRQNLICSFRAPDEEWHQTWTDFKEAVRAKGLDICFVSLSLCRAWLAGSNLTNERQRIETSTQIINLQQQNTFVYSVGKPRRTPFEASCSRNKCSRTVWSLAFQAYIVEKARDLQTSFSYLDFPELGHDLFRKLALELKQRGKILPLRPRTNPRFYILQEWKPDYPTMNENNTVKPGFTKTTQSEKGQSKTNEEGRFLKC